MERRAFPSDRIPTSCFLKGVLLFDSILDSSGCIFPVIRLKCTTPGCLLWGKMWLPRRRPGKRAFPWSGGQIGVVMGMRVPALLHLRLPVWHDCHGMCWCPCVCHVHAPAIRIQAPSSCTCPVEQRGGASVLAPRPLTPPQRWGGGQDESEGGRGLVPEPPQCC